MIKILYSISMTVLIFACFLFILSGMKWIEGSSQNNYTSEISILETFQTFGSIEQNNMEKAYPLVEKASEFALYLDPPKPPEPVVAAQPRIEAPPVYRPPSVTPQFRLLSISYYLSSPEKSLALVSEPGRGDHWIKKGERVGNFIVQNIEKGAIIYQDGTQTHKMSVTVKEPAQISQLIPHDEIQIDEPLTDSKIETPEKSKSSLSTQRIKPSLRLLNAAQAGG